MEVERLQEAVALFGDLGTELRDRVTIGPRKILVDQAERSLGLATPLVDDLDDPQIVMQRQATQTILLRCSLPR